MKLAPGQSALFGYGSLLSKPSLERTLGRSYPGPLVRSTVTGWRRGWDAAHPNTEYFTETEAGLLYPRHILYLNVRCEPSARLNGILFAVNSEELARYDARESIYDRHEITGELDVEVTGGPAYLYVCRPEHVMRDVAAPEHAAVRASYVQIVESGIVSLGAEFRELYNESSDPVPEHLVIDDHPT